VSVIAREPDDSGGPACDCGSTAVIDANRHDWRCARRLWIERGDARTELRGAVEARALLDAIRDADDDRRYLPRHLRVKLNDAITALGGQ
jgi:hypothetical protein